MPHFTVPMSPEGYAVEVMLGLPAADMAVLLAAGQVIPPPLRARGLLDTATDKTAVAVGLLQQMGLPHLGSVETQTAGGRVIVKLYRASLSVLNPAGAIDPSQARPDWVVTEFLHAPPNIDVLLGLDLARECLLILDGPGQRFTLGF